jgi:putative lipoic acid-binding regulatory protein
MQHAKQTPNPGQMKEVEYPALFHFRIITETEAQAEQALIQAVSAYQVKAPVAASHASAAGRYSAFSVSILMQSRLEMETFDATLKKVPGVRMVL